MNHNSPTHPEPLEIELLVTADERRPRRVTVADHQRFLETYHNPHEDDVDIEDLLEAVRDPSPVAIKPSRLKR